MAVVIVLMIFNFLSSNAVAHFNVKYDDFCMQKVAERITFRDNV